MKQCIRCGRSGHQSSTCQQPNPLHFDGTEPPAPDVKRGCNTCEHISVHATHEPCATCRRTMGYSQWEPMP